MTLGEFFSDRLGRLLLQAAVVIGAAFFLLAVGTWPGVVVLLLILFFITFGAIEICDFIKCRRQLLELERIMEGLDLKYLFAECVPKPETIYERKLLDLSRRAGRAMVSAVSDAKAAQREYREYVESWVHEIKAPITALQLICQSTDSKTRRRLLEELMQIEAHVERALFYARAESPEKDFLIRKASLDEIVSGAIRHHKALLIQKGIRVETRDLAKTVYTDTKWMDFILGQLLQNAARYRHEHRTPVITLSAKELGKQVQLTVCDNGIGIPAHELPRVFDKGFTGSNGRARGGSTGMGLYLCRNLAESLAIDLQITSVENEGTTLTLTLPSKENLTKS
ncbi:sensor histidine kinase [Parablautia muri]|uniref:histidine kinase n=1 Tax=Parablautia muri TaxID=2320879 RepID=A0A9X5GTC0_9FIRM|nr:sensor histidine kinase [Parablautia muri]NBJ93640.1 sensor histidine kinase [Parablautia muri]